MFFNDFITNNIPRMHQAFLSWMVGLSRFYVELYSLLGSHTASSLQEPGYCLTPDVGRRKKNTLASENNEHFSALCEVLSDNVSLLRTHDVGRNLIPLISQLRPSNSTNVVETHETESPTEIEAALIDMLSPSSGQHDLRRSSDAPFLMREPYEKRKRCSSSCTIGLWEPEESKSLKRVTSENLNTSESSACTVTEEQQAPLCVKGKPPHDMRNNGGNRTGNNLFPFTW